MTITFVNDYNDEITPEQANLSTAYIKVYSGAGVIKKKEIYENNILSFVCYYKFPSESESDIINMFSGGTIPFTIIETEILLNKKIETEKSYIGNELKRKGRNLYDSQGMLLCEETYDILTDMPMYNKTRKFFYDLSWDDFFPIMNAFYDEDRSLNRIRYDSYGADQQEIYFYLDGTPGDNDLPTLAALLNITMAEMEYYISATLEP